MSATATSDARGADATSQRRVRNSLVLLLAVHSGATDALGFVALGGAFTSVMTGNLVFVGIATAHQDGQLAALSGGSIAFFALGCVLGARLAGSPQTGDPCWPKRVSVALLAELVLVLLFLAVWEVAGADPGPTVGRWLLFLNALGLGLQSSAIQRFGVNGLSTTYLTGTLTTMVLKLAHGHPIREVRLNGALLLSLVAGAILETWVLARAPIIAPLVQVVCLLVTIGASWWCWQQNTPDGRSPTGAF